MPFISFSDIDPVEWASCRLDTSGNSYRQERIPRGPAEAAAAFYFTDYTTNNGDWTWPQNSGLWRDEAKTLFDPCPSGWRVPRGGEGERSPWQYFSSTNANNGQLNTSGIFDKGGNFYLYPQNKATCWYPALGRFNGNTAVREQGGDVGYYWTSSDVTGTVSSYHLYFTAFTIYPFNDNYHSHAFGLSVRCVRL